MKKAQIITIAEVKGGTGKTTTAAAIAQAGAAEGKKVLIIDLDAQANITTMFNASVRKPGVFDLLMRDADIKDCIQSTTQNIDIIAGAPNLFTVKFARGGITMLEDAIQPIVTKYDLIVIDTPPALHDLTLNAMQASNGLLIPCSNDISSADGMLMLIDYAAGVRNTNKKLKVLGCIITQYDKRPNICRRIRQLIEDAATAKKCPYLGEIRRGIAVQEAHAYNKNLFLYAPHSKPAEDYKELYNKIIK